MMVAIDALERLTAHSEETCGLPHWNATLHQPSCTSVAQHVRTHVFQTSPSARRSEAALYVPKPLPVLADDEADLGAPPAGPAQVPKQPRRNRNARAAFVGAASARRMSIRPD
jgi:hypothetical protein